MLISDSMLNECFKRFNKKGSIKRAIFYFIKPLFKYLKKEKGRGASYSGFYFPLFNRSYGSLIV